MYTARRKERGKWHIHKKNNISNELCMAKGDPLFSQRKRKKGTIMLLSTTISMYIYRHMCKGIEWTEWGWKEGELFCRDGITKIWYGCGCMWVTRAHFQVRKNGN